MQSSFWKYIGIQLGLVITCELNHNGGQFLYFPSLSHAAWLIFTLIFGIVGLFVIILYFLLKYPIPRNFVFNVALGIM